MSTFLDQIKSSEDRYQRFRKQRERRLDLIKAGKPFSADTPERVSAWFKRRGMNPGLAAQAVETGVMLSEASRPMGQATDEIGLERVIGAADFLGVAFLERGLAVSRTVARVSIGGKTGSPAGYGTGFMVSPTLLLTNNHVLSDARTAGDSVIEFDYYVRADGTPGSVTVFALEPGRFFRTDSKLDFTLVAVAPVGTGGATLENFGCNTLYPEEGKAIISQWVNIIQHPNGEPKQLVFRNNQIVDTVDQFLHYVADTSPGSSGSPVYNDRWEVVALHHSGVPDKDAQGRILNVDGRPWDRSQGEHRVKWKANEGLRVSRLVAFVESLRLSPEEKALFREALVARPFALPPERNFIQPSGGITPMTNKHTSTVQPDSTAVWTIPVRIAIQVGEPGAGGLPGTPAVVNTDGSVAGTGTVAQPSDEKSLLALAQRELGGRPDVMAVRLGYKFKDGWITGERAIVVKVRQKQSVHELGKTGTSPLPAFFQNYPVQVTGPTLADLIREAGVSARESLGVLEELRAEEILYKPPSNKALKMVEEVMTANLHVSPDAGWPNLDKFLRGARDKLVIGMFDFGSEHIVEAIESVRKPAFKELQLTLQRGQSVGKGTKADDLTDDEVVERLHKRFGSKFKFGWIKIGVKNGWVASSYHIKVAVRDGKAFWLSSGNWQSSNQPKVNLVGSGSKDYSYLKKYNREWHAVIENRALAEQFEAYLRHDYKSGTDEKFEEAFTSLPVLQIPAAEAVFKAPSKPSYKYFKPLEIKRKVRVTPLLTPDNYFEALLKMIKEAEHEILIQNQTFNAPKNNHKHLEELMELLLAKQKRMPVRIIFRVLMQSNARENLEALKDLGFDTDNIKVQVGLHTKGIIIDGKKMMLGSQNISEQGISINRDASLIFYDKEVAQYFRGIFEHDWENVAQRYIGSDLEAAWGDAREGKVVAKQGYQALSPKEYLELL